MSDLPPNGLSATEASEKIRQGWLTSVELTTACLNRIEETDGQLKAWVYVCLLYTSPSPRDRTRSRMPSSA